MRASRRTLSLAGKTIEEILGVISTQPPLVRNNGGGYWNHDFFWKIMTPGGGTPSGKLAEAIDAYGGLDKLKEDFNGKGAGQFGSGWAWVITDADGKLQITSTPEPGQSADGRRRREGHADPG